MTPPDPITTYSASSVRMSRDLVTAITNSLDIDASTLGRSGAIHAGAFWTDDGLVLTNLSIGGNPQLTVTVGHRDFNRTATLTLGAECSTITDGNALSVVMLANLELLRESLPRETAGEIVEAMKELR